MTMIDFLENICSRWSSFTNDEKDAIANILVVKNILKVKDEDIILVKIPVDEETGMYLLDYDILNGAYRVIKQIFKNNKVLMTPLEVNVSSEKKETDNV